MSITELEAIRARNASEERALANHPAFNIFRTSACRDIAALLKHADNLRGAMIADYCRLITAARRVDMDFGCDSADHMADAIVALRAEAGKLRAAP